MKEISLIKGRETFSIRYEVGDELAVLDQLVSMVNQKNMNFDWFDAAVLSHQVGQHLTKELRAYMPKKQS